MNISVIHKTIIAIVLVLSVIFHPLTAQTTIKGKRIYYIDNYTEYLAKQYFDNNLSDLDPIEGIWINDGIAFPSLTINKP